MSIYRERTLFNDIDNNEHFDGLKRAVENIIKLAEDIYILNVNETDYINYLIDKSKLDRIQLNVEEIFQDIPTEEDVRSDQHPYSFIFKVGGLISGQNYKRTVFKFYLPFHGDSYYFSIKPSITTTTPPRASIEDNYICIKIIDFEKDVQIIKDAKLQFINNIMNYVSWLNNDIDAYNRELVTLIPALFRIRKQEILEKHKMVAEIGVPVRQSMNVPDTFAISHVVKKKMSIIKPQVHESTFKPEPTLDNSVYEAILKVIYDTGRKLEMLPSTYHNKCEEDLRDLFLLPLEANIEGEATGETFNKVGKTDIMIKHEGKNIFIGELKFWKGRKAYLEGITQLLSYLTWRDSKVALVIFATNHDITNVVKTIETCTVCHGNYLSIVKSEKEGWIKYRFHLPGDKNREVWLSVIIFHFPKNILK